MVGAAERREARKKHRELRADAAKLEERMKEVKERADANAQHFIRTAVNLGVAIANIDSLGTRLYPADPNAPGIDLSGYPDYVLRTAEVVGALSEARSYVRKEEDQTPIANSITSVRRLIRHRGVAYLQPTL